MGTQNKLLDTEFVKKLERLSVAGKPRPFRGRLKGNKRSAPRRGLSVEFSERPESAHSDQGDGGRRGGTAMTRLERLFVQLFVEEDLSIHLLVDASQSMEHPVVIHGGAVATKFDFARKVAAALGYVSLVRHERVGVAGFSQSRGSRVPTLRGRTAVPALLSFLEGLRPGGRTDFARALQNLAMRTPSPAMFVLLSDFFDPGWEKGVRALLARRHHVILLQILAPDELEPTAAGDLRLVDAATGAGRDLSLTPAVLANYREALRRFCGILADRSARHGMDYLRAATDVPFEDLLLKTLHNAVLLND
jgi:uncharacterized protein (DUF58 family)